MLFRSDVVTNSRKDSSVSSCRAEKVVTSAAYLLFYRRRSAAPLGSPALQQLVQDFRDPAGTAEDTNSDAESRTESPSGQGKGQRLDGSSLSGSSSALVVAGAGRQALGGDGLAATHSGRARTGIDDSYDADADGEEDEAIDMTEGDALPTYGPDPPSYHNNEYSQIEGNPNFSIQDMHEGSWGWSTINIGGTQPKENWNDDDAASNLAADGNDDDEGGFEDQRLLEDFGDEESHGATFGIDSMHQNSPMMEPLLGNTYDEDIPDLVPDGIGRSFPDDEGIGGSGSGIALHLNDEDILFTEPEPPVAEVRIEDSPKLEGEVHKKSE
jgi:ubiquitin carboxyl-terminal hydrolase 4/11/15